MKLKDNLSKILITFFMIMYIIGLFIGNTYNIIVLSIVGNISIVLGVCVPLYQIKNMRIPVTIFISTFLSEQAIGYGFNIGFLKYFVYPNSKDHYMMGTEISIVSIVFPVVIALIISFAYKMLRKKTT